MKTIAGLDRTYEIAGQPPMTAKRLISTALESFQPSLKGIDNILNLSRVYEKITTAGDTAALEDAEFQLLYKAVDSMQWLGAILRCADFIKDLKNASKND